MTRSFTVQPKAPAFQAGAVDWAVNEDKASYVLADGTFFGYK